MYPVLFRIGNVGIRTYGVILVIAFFICLYIAKWDGKRLGLSKKEVDHLANYLLLWGLVGARLYYALFYDPQYYFTRPWTLLFIWEGGLAIHGAIIGGIFGLYLYTRKYKYNFWTLADFVTPLLLLGQGIGRIGCFLNGCCFGRPTDKPWGVIFPKDSFAYYRYGFTPVHPTQLYEMVLDLVGFIFFWLGRRKKRFSGALFSWYLVYYGVVRFVVSVFRADSLYIWGTGVKVAYLLSSMMIIAGIYLHFTLKNKDKNLKGT